MPPKITVAGSSNVDLIMKMARLPRLGETVTDGTFVQVYGGKGANQAVGAARAGATVDFINAVGDDAYTDQMLRNFQDDGINVEYVFQDEGIPSGHALVMIGGEGNNYLSVAPGANHNVTPERVDQARSAIIGADVVIIQNEIPMDANARVLAIAAEAGVPVLWNFAPAVEYPRELLDYAPLLVANETEAEFLTDIPVTDYDSAVAAARKLRELGCPTAIVTLGSKGSVAITETDELIQVDAFPVEAVDTTAAGDVFCGSLAVAMAEGQSLADAMRFASAAAALAVQVLGAQPSAPRRERIEALLAG